MDIVNDVTIHPKIKAALTELMKIGAIGLSRMKKLRISYNDKNVPDSNVHSFIVDVPYADNFLSWEVIFSNEDITFAPDFDFGNDQFLADPDIDVIEKHLPSLAHWNIDDPKCLYKVIDEILQLYAKHQVDRLNLNKFSRQLADYFSLTSNLNVLDKDIEVLVDVADCVQFLVALPVDITVLPPYMGDYFETGRLSNPGAEVITVKLTYITPIKLQSCVWLSPSLEEILSPAKLLHLPSLNREGNLEEYIPQIRKAVQERLEEINSNYNRRNEFVSVMLALQPGSILEYDNVHFSKMTMMLEVHEHRCLMFVHLGTDFKKPNVQLRPLARLGNGKAMVENLSFPFKPSASVEENVKKILNSVHAYLGNYKQNELRNINQAEKQDAFYTDLLKQ